jgi:translation initiation factor RLI1
LKAVVKPQYVDQIPKAVKSADKTVQTLLKARVQMDNYEEILSVLGGFDCRLYISGIVLIIVQN